MSDNAIELPTLPNSLILPIGVAAQAVADLMPADTKWAATQDEFKTDKPHIIAARAIEQVAAQSASYQASRLVDLKAEIKARVADARDRARTPGKDGVYLSKLGEVQAWRAAGEPLDPDPALYPHMAQEVGLSAPSAADLATLWEGKNRAWMAASAALEGLAFQAARDIESALTSAATVRAVMKTLSDGIAATLATLNGEV